MFWTLISCNQRTLDNLLCPFHIVWIWLKCQHIVSSAALILTTLTSHYHDVATDDNNGCSIHHFGALGAIWSAVKFLETFMVPRQQNFWLFNWLFANTIRGAVSDQIKLCAATTGLCCSVVASAHLHMQILSSYLFVQGCLYLLGLSSCSAEWKSDIRFVSPKVACFTLQGYGIFFQNPLWSTLLQSWQTTHIQVNVRTCS